MLSLSRPTENRVEDSRVSSDCELSGGSRVVSVTIGQSLLVTATVNILRSASGGQTDTQGLVIIIWMTDSDRREHFIQVINKAAFNGEI